MAFQMYANLHQPPETNDYKRGWNAALDAARLTELMDLTAVIDDEDGRDYLFDSMVQIQEVVKKALELYKEIKT